MKSKKINLKAVGGKFLKGTIGGAAAVAATLISTGQAMAPKTLAISLGVGAFHGGYRVLKDLGWIPAK